MTKIKNSFSALALVFCRWQYIALAFVVCVALIILAIWMPNIGLLVNYFGNENITIAQKLQFFFSGLAAFQTNFTTASQSMTVAVTLLFGINVSVAMYAFRRRAALASAQSSSVLGLLVGLLGIGCVSCGSFLLASFFGLGASLAFINILPFHGYEFGIIAIAILLFSIAMAAKKVGDPLICDT